MRVRCVLISFLGIAVLFSFLHAGTAFAQSDRADVRTDAQWHPDVLSDTLANGLRIYFTKVNDIPLAEISIVIDAGVGNEAPGEQGVSHMTSQLLIKGSSQRDAAMISRRLDQLGSYVLPYTHYDYAQLYGKTLTRNFRSTLEIMADAIVSPTFPEVELEKYQQEAATAIVRMPSSAAEQASAKAIALLFGDHHPLTRPLQPDMKDLEAVTRTMIADFHQRWFTPERCTVIISGDLDYSFVQTLLLEVFGRWERGNAGASPHRGEAASTDDVVVIDHGESGKGLAFFRMAMPTPRRSADEMPALVLLNSVFGEGDSSALRTALWGEHILSPSFSSALGFSKDGGYLMISGSVSPGLADSVLVILEQRIARIARDGVTEAQLQRAKARLLTDSPLTFASNRNLLSLLKETAVYGLDLQKVLHFSQRIRAVRVEDVQRLAGKVFDQTAIRTVILGDAERLMPELRALGRGVTLAPGDQN